MNSSSTSSSEPAPGRTIGSLRAIGFVAGAIGVLLVLNAVGGIKKDTTDRWMGPLLADSARPYTTFFIGSSRVAAAIDAAAFDSVLGTAGIENRSINLGMGYSRISEYRFAIRHVLSRKPDLLRGATVFLEAPAGSPEYSTWEDNWMVEDAYANLAPYLKVSDLPRFILHSKSTPLSKGLVAARVLFGFQENFSRLRYHASDAIHKFLARNERAGRSRDNDLSAAGGIRTDSAGIAEVRRIALGYAQIEIREQVPQRDWDRTTFRDFVAFLQSAGAEVVLYDMPLSHPQAVPFLTPVRQEDRKVLERSLPGWNIRVLHPSIATVDDDFPDLWHLRKSRSKEFTTTLARSHLDSKGIPPAP